jgi:hypothetical protein
MSEAPATCRRAIIVASGQSARYFIPPEDSTIIAVNGVIDWIARADYFFTLDLSVANFTRLHRRRDGVSYHIAGLPHLIPGVTSYRKVANRGKEPRPKGTPEWWLWRWSAVCGLSENKADIHTGNSAWGALGLARHLGFTDVALVGVDATSEPRIEGGRPNNLSHLPLLFASTLKQINVVSCGKLMGIPKMPFAEWYHKR